MGEPRKAKAFDLFLECIEHLVPSLQAGRLRLIVQSISSEKAQADVRDIVAKLNKMKQNCLSLDVLEGPLERRLYSETLSVSRFRCTAVSYNVGQSSGIVFEALQQGTPVVVTAGLSFPTQLEPMMPASKWLVRIGRASPAGF